MTSTLDKPATASGGKPDIDQQLRHAQDTFSRRWGEMGQTWGINRTMAEIHALLYITAQPLCTDDVMERLHISRGNASMSLRALCDWGIVRRLHRRGERRERLRFLAGKAQSTGERQRAILVRRHHGRETAQRITRRAGGAFDRQHGGETIEAHRLGQ